MPLTRVTVTIPDELVAWADERAEALDRSRSWLVSEALRRYLREVGVSGERGGRSTEPDGPAPLDGSSPRGGASHPGEVAPKADRGSRLRLE